MKRALVIGINGMDGSYLADILIDRGYEVHGVVRRSSQPNLWRIQHCLDKITLHQGDLLDAQRINSIIGKVRPTEIYNEADQDHVGYSFDSPKCSVDVTYGGVASLLEMLKGNHTIKLFQPLSATMFGNAEAPQTLETPFDPQSPYAVAKVAAYYLCKHYREKYGVQVYTAILYNHDSVRRQGDYLLHDICKNAVKIAHGDAKYLPITDLGKRVDIGWAKDYMECVVMQVQEGDAGDRIIGSGIAQSIYQMINHVCSHLGLPYSPCAYVKTPNASPTDNYLLSNRPCSQITKTVFDLLDDLCNHYETQLYGAVK